MNASLSGLVEGPLAVFVLRDGRVLVTGGYRQGPLASAETYDPSTRTWTETGFMECPRSLHAAALLEDGRVLVAGGAGYQEALASAEVYDPAIGTWSSA